MKPHVIVGTPIYERPEPEYMLSTQVLQHFGPGTLSRRVEIGKPIAEARNEITKSVLYDADGQPLRLGDKEDTARLVTHILWMDCDMDCPPDALRRLMVWDKPIVGGLCYNRRHPYMPVVAKYWDKSWGFDDGAYGWCYDLPKEGLFQCDVTGAAFLLVQREVFDEIKLQWGWFCPTCSLPPAKTEIRFSNPVCARCLRRAEPISNGGEHWAGWFDTYPGTQLSEDISFCRRATEAGFPIYIDCGLEIGHYGKVRIGREFAEKNTGFHHNAWQPTLKPGDIPLTFESVEKAALQPGSAAVVSEKPVVSIIIPTYNQKLEFLEAAVRSALAQTVPVEVIVVFDGDGATRGYSVSWVEEDFPFKGQHERINSGYIGATVTPTQELELPAGVKVIHLGVNKGVAAALNAGIKAMTTDWFCWLSSDDLIYPRKVEAQLAALLLSHGRASCHGFDWKTDNMNAVSQVFRPSWRTIEEQRATLSKMCAINGSTAMIHRSVFNEVGVFDESYAYGQDWEMWCRIGQKFLWHVVNENLGCRRDSGSNLTKLIERDPAKKERKLAEDNRIAKEYGVK